MPNTSKKILFFGTEDFSAESLQALIKSGYEISAVITKPDSKKGRGQILSSPKVKTIAEGHNIPVWQPEKLSEIADDIIKLQPVVGILVSFGKIIPTKIIELFDPGIINLHPSLLPKYRGPTPIESAIESGDKTTGVSIMQLSAGMDAGPVFYQQEHELRGTETQPELYQTLAELGAQTLIGVLPSILDGSLPPKPQDDSQASYCKLLQKSDSVLDPLKQTAQEAERKIRAHLKFPKTKTTILGQSVIITQAHISRESKTPLDVVCRGGEFLSIDELVAPSGRLVAAESFLNGYAA